MTPITSTTRAVVPPIVSSEPRLWYSAERLAVLRRAYREEAPLFTEALASVIGMAKAALEPGPTPYEGGDPAAWRESMNADGKRAVCLALAWHLTGRDDYRTRTADLLRAQMEAMPHPLNRLSPENRFPNLGLDAICGSSGLILAWDLLAATPNFAAALEPNWTDWLRQLELTIRTAMARWEESGYFGGQNFQNHVGEHMMGLAQIGMVLGDRELVQFALDSDENQRDLKAMIAGAIHIAGDKPEHESSPQTGEMFDRYRTSQGSGFHYSFHALRMLLLAAELAWRLGLDFYRFKGPRGQRLDLPFLFYRDFVLTGESTLKGGYYQDSSIRPGQYGEYYELGILRYPEHREAFLSVLTSPQYDRLQPNFHPVHKPTLSWLLAFAEPL